MAEQQTQLKAGAIGTAEATIMAICAAGPAFCLAGSMGLLAQQTGKGVGLSCVIATLVVVLIGLSYGKLSEKYNRCGGTWSYMQQAMGNKVGLWTAFVYFGVFITTSACPATIFSIYLNYLVPAIPLWCGWFVCIIPVLLITWFGVELSARTLVVVWVVQMALLAWPAIKIMAMADGLDFGYSLGNTFTPSLGVSGLMLATLTWIWAYVGFEAPAYMGEELKGGSKAVKFAIPISGLGVGVIYVIACWLWTASMPEAQLTALANDPNTMGTFLASYAAAIGYAAGDTLVAFAALVSAFACALAFYSFMPRFFFDLAREKFMPKPLAKLNKHQIPHMAMFTYAFVSFFSSLYAMYGYSDSGFFDGINDWFVIMGITASFAYGAVCIANIKDGWKDSSFFSGIIMRKIIPLITTAILGYMIATSMLTPKYFWFVIIWVILALIYALVLNPKRKTA